MTQSSNIKRAVMITGAARGFGKSLVQKFRADEYQIFGTARVVPEKIEQGDVWHKLDVSIYEHCVEAIEFGFEQFGRIDVLVNNASAYTGGATIAEISKEDIDSELDTTLRGPMYLSKLYVERARSQGFGKIIFVSSIAGLEGELECGSYSIYAAAKAGLIRFTETLNEDIQKFGMQAHVLVPCSMQDLNTSPIEDAISYNAAAHQLLEIAKSTNNSVFKTVLRPNI